MGHQGPFSVNERAFQIHWLFLIYPGFSLQILGTESLFYKNLKGQEGLFFI